MFVQERLHSEDDSMQTLKYKKTPNEFFYSWDLDLKEKLREIAKGSE